MLRILHFFLLAALMLLPVACAQPDASSDAVPVAQQAAERQRTSPGPRIVFLGDSLTAGLGLPREQSVPSLIQARLNSEGYRYEVINAGVSGDTSAGGLNRLAWSLAGGVEVLVSEPGAPDALRGAPAAHVNRALNE